MSGPAFDTGVGYTLRVPGSWFEVDVRPGFNTTRHPRDDAAQRVTPADTRNTRLPPSARPGYRPQEDR